MDYEEHEYEADYGPDIDEAYDRLVDDCLLCDSEEEAQRLVKYYGNIAKQRLTKYGWLQQ